MVQRTDLMELGSVTKELFGLVISRKAWMGPGDPRMKTHDSSLSTATGYNWHSHCINKTLLDFFNV